MKKEEKKDIQWRSIMRHYWYFARVWKWHLMFVLFVLAILSVLSSAVVPLIMKGIVDTVSGASTQFGVYEWLGFLALAYIFELFISVLVGFIDVRVIAFTARDLENNLFRQLTHRSYTFFSNTFGGGLVAKAKRFLNSFQGLYDQFIWNLWQMCISLIATMGVLLYVSWQLGIIFFVWIVLFGVTVYYFLQYAKKKTDVAAEADSRITARFSDAITNILTIKMFSGEHVENEAFKEISQDRTEKRYDAWKTIGPKSALLRGMLTTSFQLMLLFSVIVLWEQGIVTAGAIVLVVMVGFQSTQLVYRAGHYFTQIVRMFSDAQEMIDILDAPNDIVDPAHPQPLIVKEGRVSFRDITHGYEDGNALFEHFSLDIAGGEKVAFVGKSGSGKTTLTKLLLRFIDVREGRVLIDDTDVREVTQADLRMHIAYVPQEPMLFHRSLFENIAYGKQDATLEEVKEVARRARASDFIEALPQGYDTLVGERGVKLSGGERQRVAIARALLKDAPIVVLDEATSALDSEAEEAIQQAFDELMKGRTTIVIAHRLSTIAHMDRIVVLDGGRIVEQGTHAELIARGGAYAELWNKQVGGFLRE
jgi:ATP-binding cassette, subfamily B, bacterial